MKLLLQLYNFIGSLYLSLILNAEQRKRPFPVMNERAIEYSFSFHYLRLFGKGKLLDIGSGRSSWPHLLSTCGFDVTAIDKKSGYWNSYFNRHYKIINDDITDTKLTGKFQFITCISTLEHIQNHYRAILNISNLLEVGGYLILTFPYNEYLFKTNVNSSHINYITQVFSRYEIDMWLETKTLTIIYQNYYQIFTGNIWGEGKRISPYIATNTHSTHHLTCILLQKNKYI